jgi:hypothetical protein
VAQKWTKKELDFVSQYGEGMSPADIYKSYCKKFPNSNRTYSSVRNKFNELIFQPKTSNPEVDNEEVENPYSKSKYVYLEEKDEYLIPTQKGMLHLSGKTIRELVSDYSNYGAQATINKCARKFGTARNAVIDIIKALGKTHDSSPFTSEEILANTEEYLISDIVSKKEHKIIVKADKVLQKALEKDAENWRKLNQSIDKVFNERVYEALPDRTKFKLDKPKSEFDIVLYHTDAHVGKLAEGWSLKETRDVILNTAERALAHAVQYGAPTRILTCIGGDWANIDTPSSTTTRGTRQVSNAEWFDIMDAANQITLDLLTLMSDVAPVKAFTVPGNHDRMWSVLAGSWLSKLFQNSDRVTIEKVKHRHYLKSGSNMLMFSHGDLAKPSEYPTIMASEAPVIWGQTEHRYAYHGHLHHEVMKEYRGVNVTQMPSVSPTDDWHEGEGWIGTRRALVAYIHDYKAGRVANFNIGVKNGIILG